MIDLILRFGNEQELITIEGKQVYFTTSEFGAVRATIDGLKISHDGAIREFPDLKDDKEWRRKAIERFKEKIRSFKTEDEICNYVISELAKFGHIPELKQRAGFRPVKIKWPP